MGKAGLAFVLLIVLVASAVYVAGLGDDLVNMTGNAVKELASGAGEAIKGLVGEKVADRLKDAEKDAESKLGNTIGDDNIRINLTNPLTGDKVEYACEKGVK